MKTSGFLAALLALVSAPIFAQPGARLVKDVNPSSASLLQTAPFSAFFTRMGDAVYFTIDDGIHGMELWRSDGTSSGTALVKDLCPGTCPSLPHSLTDVGDLLYFSARDEAHGRELWRSDGTAEGTWAVDLVPGLQGSDPQSLAPSSGTDGGRVVYFAAATPETGTEVWQSDGTLAGTSLVADVRPGPESAVPKKLQVLGGVLYFAANDGVHGQELWRSDGTAAGTRLVKDIYPGKSSSGGGDNSNTVQPAYLPLPGGNFLFTADDGVHGLELWASDGTSEGTVLVRDIREGLSGSGAYELTLFDHQVYLTASDGLSGRELWKSDGTADGTQLVKDIWAELQGSAPKNLTTLGSRLFFSANDGVHGEELWVSDGTQEGTRLVRNIDSGPGSSLGFPGLRWGFYPLGDSILIYADDGATGFEPWVSDGTEQGTLLLRDANPNISSSFLGAWMTLDGAAEIGGKLLFRLLTDAGLDELWATDGTPAGTNLVLDLDTQTSSIPYEPFLGIVRRSGATVGDALIYSASNGPLGEEPWVSDGTATGTKLLQDISPNLGGSFPGPFTTAAGAVFFGAENADYQGELWRSDGTPEGTERVLSSSAEGGVSPSFDLPGLELNGELLFAGYNLGSGEELWTTDGTAIGTFQVKDIEPGAGGSSPRRFVAFEDRAYFSARTDAENGEPWSTDGTTAGTSLLANIHPTSYSQFTPLGTVGGRLLFAADDGVSGRELWALDAGGATPHRVRDIYPGASSGVSLPPYKSRTSAVLDDLLYFVASDGVQGEELWRSDGTQGGTFLLLDLVPGPGSAEPRWLTVAGGILYFVANDGITGRELWKSDGTNKGTKRVADLAPGPQSSVPSQLMAIGSTLYFSAYQPATGRELWRTTPVSGGSTGGAELVADIAPGPLSSSPLALRRTGAHLLFAANDHTHGFELWAVAPKELFEDGFETGDTSRWNRALDGSNRD